MSRINYIKLETGGGGERRNRGNPPLHSRDPNRALSIGRFHTRSGSIDAVPLNGAREEEVNHSDDLLDDRAEPG